MPQIIVTTDGLTDRGERVVMHRERVTISDLESPHFAGQLLERLNWAVGDAHQVELRPPDPRTETVLELERRPDREPARAPIAPQRSARVVTTAS